MLILSALSFPSAAVRRVCALPPAGQQVRPDPQGEGAVEHQPAGPAPPGGRAGGGHPLPLHVHPDHPHRPEAAEAPL